MSSLNSSFQDTFYQFWFSRAIQYLSGDAETPRQYLMAGSVIVTLPVLFIFIYFEKISCKWFDCWQRKRIKKFTY